VASWLGHVTLGGDQVMRQLAQERFNLPSKKIEAFTSQGTADLGIKAAGGWVLSREAEQQHEQEQRQFPPPPGPGQRPPE